MTSKYIEELRDKAALEILPLLLFKCHHLDLEQITDYAYHIADLMLISRDKKENTLFNNNIGIKK
jgi:hypothetical protein